MEEELIKKEKTKEVEKEFVEVGTIEQVDKTTVTIYTSLGPFTLRKPKAGVRNRCMIAAETDSGAFRRTTFLFMMLPKCVIKRPEGVDDTVKIENILDSMETEDYDLIQKALWDMINPNDIDVNEDPEEKKG